VDPAVHRVSQQEHPSPMGADEVNTFLTLARSAAAQLFDSSGRAAVCWPGASAACAFGVSICFGFGA